MNQRQATVSTILSVLESRGADYTGDVPVSEVLTDTDKHQIVTLICQGFMAGKIEMSAEGKAKYFKDPKELRKYTVGLVNNWVRKAPELNCGVHYEPKNPGSRQGSGDSTLKALKALLKVTVDAEAKKEIQAAIDERMQELQPKTTIDVSSLPAHLRHLVK